MSHENPTGYWEYEGSYTVLLVDGENTDQLPDGATTEGKIVSVQRGSIKQTMGGIQFYTNGEPFAWGYKNIREIRNGSDQLIWQNHNYREKKEGK